MTVYVFLTQIGLDKHALNPRYGDSLDFTLNGELKSVKGTLGEPCKVYLNNELSNLDALLIENEEIKLIPSTKGEKGEINIAKINSDNAKIGLCVNKMNVNLPCAFSANGKTVTDSYKIQMNDNIEILDYITVERAFELLDITLKEGQKVSVTDNPTDFDTKLSKGYRVDVI